MRPQLALDAATLRANAVAWRAHCGVALWAVIKSDGYGWGHAALVRALSGAVDGFFVSDVDEFDSVRALTTLPIATLADVAPAAVGRILDAGGIPNVSTVESLDAASSWGRAHGTFALIRVGLRSAAGWAGIDSAGIASFASRLAASACAAQCWTHITDSELAAEQWRAFAGMRAAFAAAGVQIAGCDFQSSSLAPAAPGCTLVRVGAGLFGFGFGGPAVRCALRVAAPVVDRIEACGQRTGYGLGIAPSNGMLVVVRCGYGDGFPRVVGGGVDILSVGMQYTVIRRTLAFNEAAIELIGDDTDLDLLARSAGVAPHELIVRLGLAHRATGRCASGIR